MRMGLRKASLLFMLLCLGLTGAGSLHAQARNVSVRIFTDPPGPIFMVDGAPFRIAAVLLWPEGTKHELYADAIEASSRPDTIYAGACWSTNLRPNECLTGPITADRDLTWVRFSYAVYDKVSVSFFDCPAGEQCVAYCPPDGGACSYSSGRVQVKCDPLPGSGLGQGGQVVFERSGAMFCREGKTVELTAYPNRGFVFVGWSPLGGITHSNAFQWTFTLPSPVVVNPIFQRARPVKVTVETSPPGLKVLADRAPIGDILEWEYGTVHSLGVGPAQYDNDGHLWVFDSWSDGGAINHDITVPVGQATLAFTARFLPGSTATFLTDPPLLKLKIDGRENWQNYTFQWAAGTKHQVSAPAEQLDAQGRKYRFVGWSNGQPASHEVTIEGDTRLTAAYKPIGQINLTSSLPGARINVDGEPCVTPCALEREVGANVRVIAPDVQATGDGSRMVFRGWADAAGGERAFTVTRDPLTLRAEYQMQHRLGMAVEPGEGAACYLEPRATDGYYDAGVEVTVRLDPYPGFRVTGWDGDWSGSRTFGVVRMTAPKSVRARLEAVPYLPVAAVRNSAGETPREAVAPGSIISIFGKNLAPGLEAGPENPLAQTIAGVTVRVPGVVLPLVMVSPEEIRAQLPSDIGEGQQNLTVRWEGKPETSAPFTVARNAPGLFYKDVEGRPFGLFVHEDGQAVSAGSPARRGETVTLFGTGLGPLKRLPPDGFLLPETADFRLADPVELIYGEAAATPLYAGSTSVAVGLNAVRFRITEDFPRGETVPVKVRVNGVDSNTVLLPVE